MYNTLKQKGKEYIFEVNYFQSFVLISIFNNLLMYLKAIIFIFSIYVDITQQS
ncbi:hypothetical protein HOLleu_24629 [Holothuria leucospilota]|uniref:Uncharacterized protein n=1 Tax=Holothuria leucospilota TaxID=206669 RepID=A0A9Q1H3S5_HOLLE|nr:hypothetical protein HOLleu_24629 [Holothuria leucospilota]